MTEFRNMSNRSLIAYGRIRFHGDLAHVLADRLAIAIEAPSGVETTKIGSTEGESAGRQASPKDRVGQSPTEEME